MSGFAQFKSLLSDAVETVFPGVTTEHGKAKADAVIAEFSEREELLAEVYKKAHYDLLNTAYAPGINHQDVIGRELVTNKDVTEYISDPEELRKAAEFNLEHIFKDDAYSDITANEVMEFADGLDHRVQNRIFYPPSTDENTQTLDTLS